MKWGLGAEAIQGICRVLERFSRVDKAVLYGSRALGTFKPGSDIDLTLFGPGLDWAECAVIADEIDELLLPWELDLSIYELLAHEGLRAHIQRAGVVFWERTGARAAAEGL